MRRARLLLLFGLWVAGAAAACVQNSDGCLTCSPDGVSCTECDSGYALQSSGSCADCSGAAADPGVRCSKCNGDDPRTCLQCEATSSDTGAYIDASGACKACPAGCTSCRDGDGSCDLQSQSSTASKEDSGSRQCPEHCTDCNRRGKCFECEDGWSVNQDGACVQCGEHCLQCTRSRGVTTCDLCASGYGPIRGRCQACSSPACTSCPDGPAQCDECRDGFVAYEGGCSKCSASTCLRCDPADPNRCLECAGSLGADASGKCIEGQVQHCESIDPSNASSCLKCVSGFSEVLDEASGAYTCQQAPPPASQKLRLRHF